MSILPWKTDHGKLDKKILRKNDISLLILDERWNRLFINTPKTPAIEHCEQKLRELLKEEARLNTEKKEIAALKKKHMDNIIKLTPDVFEKGSEAAKKEMQQSEHEIKRINARASEIDELLENMPDRIKQANIELLENTVGVVYFKIRSSKKRVEELEKLIENTKAKLKEYIDEKESLSQDDTDIYSYFHDLLGAEELERLDNKYFAGRGK
jgi:phage terminase Nu1 subunit (DNA packaging protein)